MFAWLEARVWQVGAIGGGMAAVGLAVALGVTTFQKNGVEKDLANAQAEIVQLTGNLRTCRGNTRTLEAGIRDANGKVTAAAQQRDARVAQAEREVAAVRQANAATQSRLNRLLSAPANGATTCERVDQVDRAIQDAFQ